MHPTLSMLPPTRVTRLRPAPILTVAKGLSEHSAGGVGRMHKVLGGGHDRHREGGRSVMTLVTGSFLDVRNSCSVLERGFGGVL